MAIFRKKSGQTIDRGTKSYYTPNNRKKASDPLGNVVPATGIPTSDAGTITRTMTFGEDRPVTPSVTPVLKEVNADGTISTRGGVSSATTTQSSPNLLGTPGGSASSPVPVATSTEPVIDRSLDKPDKTIEIPQVDIRGMSTDDMYDFIDIVNFKQQKGEAITDEEQMKLMKINRALSQPQAATVENAAQAELMRLQSERELEAARVKDQAARTFETQEQVIEDEYDARRRREIEAGERQKETQLRILGDNAFSSRASVALADIDDAVSENLRILDNLENAQMQRALAEQANATSETLQSYDSLIAQMQAKTTELNLAIAEQTNEMNLQAGASYQEKIQNIMTIANQMPEAPLTPAEEALVGSYAQLLIDDKGNIDSNLLKMIPSKLISSVMLKAAEVKGATRTEETVDQSKFQWKEGEDGLFYRTNPITGQLETSATNPSQEPEVTGFVDGIGSGNVTAYGTDANPFGLDIDGQIGDGINSSFDGTVIEVGNDPAGWGNYMIVEDSSGNKVRYAHLNEFGVNEGDKIYRGQMIATIGNTGYVIPGPNGDGSHVDITVTDKDGNKKSPQEAEVFLKGGAAVAEVTGLSPIAQAVIDGTIPEDKIKDNVKDKNKVPEILAEVQRRKRENVDTSQVDQETQDLITVLEGLRNIPRRKRISAETTESGALRGGVGGIWSVLAPGAVDIKTGFDRIRDTLTLDYLIDLKQRGATFGALSEQELRSIAGAVSQLDLQQSNSSWKQEVDRIIKKIQEGKELLQQAENDPLGIR